MSISVQSPASSFLREPSPRQHEWIDAYAREKLFGGAKRGGKSVALAMHCALLCIEFPGNRGLLARKNMTDLKDTTLDEFYRTVPAEWYREHKGNRTLTFGNGSEILYRGLGDESDYEKAKSMTLGFLAIDEPTEVPFASYQQLNGQLTHVLPNGRRPAYMSLLTSNPEPGWVKDRFVTTMVPGGLYMQALPRDNPFLPPGWEAELRASMPEEWVQRYLDGSWDVFEGQVFTELLDRVHNLDQWTSAWSKPHWDLWWRGLRKIGCIDHATTGITTYGQDGIDSSENMFSVGEYYWKDRLISEHAEEMKQLQLKFGGTLRRMASPPNENWDDGVTTTVDLNEYTLIDPSTSAKTQQGSHSLFSFLDVYHRNGMPAVPGPGGNIGVGLDQMKQLLKVSPNHRHPFTGVLGSPRWFISHSQCPNLWKEMTELRKKLLPAGGVQYIGADHAVDTKRYVIMNRPRAAETPILVPAAATTLDLKKGEMEAAFRKKWQQELQGSNRWY